MRLAQSCEVSSIIGRAANHDLHNITFQEKNMNNKNTSLIATIAATVLCGCPGLLGLCFGLTSVFASLVPGAQIDVFGSSDPRSATAMGLVTLCVSVIFIAIPFVTWLVTRRKPATELPPNEPIPPAG
jgi:hypothetical protein